MLASASGLEKQFDCVISGKVSHESLFIGKLIITANRKKILNFGSIKSDTLNCLTNEIPSVSSANNVQNIEILMNKLKV